MIALFRLLAALLCLSMSQAAFAQSGSISASPATVVIAAGNLTGSTAIGWNASGGSAFHVTVNCGGGEQLMASSGAGSYTVNVPWIQVGSSCIFRLRTPTVTGTVLSAVTVTGVTASGTIAASPATVLIPAGQSVGTSEIQWIAANGSQFSVTVSCGGGAEGLFASSSAGSYRQNAPWITVGASCVFRLRAGTATGLVLDSVTVTGQQSQGGTPLITTQRGGSNHQFYKVPPPSSGDSAYHYGIMLHYHEPGVRSTVQNQLQQMYQNGQRSLRVMVYFLHAPGSTITTTPAESSRKCRVATQPCPAGSEYFLPLQYQQNMRDYLADIRAAGFERVMLALGPQWINDFGSCNSSAIPLDVRQQLYAASPLVNELFEEAWGVAKETHAIAVGSGLPYLIDLGNEYMPPSNLVEFGQCAKDIIEGTATTPGYLRFMWGRYVANYGNQDTVGFSVIVGNSWDADNRLARMPQFLSPLPSVYSLHSYTGNGDVAAGLSRAYAVTGNFGRRPWIIGETDGRSPAAASAIRSFILNTPQQQVLHVMQWPGFNCSTETECLPLDFSTFSSQGL